MKLQQLSGLMALGAEATFVINLFERADRRLECVHELSLLGPDVGGGAAEFLLRRRPQDAGGFESIGARGCFESHLHALRRGAGARSILILEDDIAFDLSAAPAAHETLSNVDGWDICYGGFDDAWANGFKPPQGVSEMPVGANVRQTHCIAFSSRVTARLIVYLEAILRRSPGDPAGGPMHVDGAYWHFRKDNPDIRAVILSPMVGRQRASHSDIAEPTLLGRLPGVKSVRSITRRLRGHRSA